MSLQSDSKGTESLTPIAVAGAGDHSCPCEGAEESQSEPPDKTLIPSVSFSEVPPEDLNETCSLEDQVARQQNDPHMIQTLPDSSKSNSSMPFVAAPSPCVFFGKICSQEEEPQAYFEGNLCFNIGQGVEFHPIQNQVSNLSIPTSSSTSYPLIPPSAEQSSYASAEEFPRLVEYIGDQFHNKNPHTRRTILLNSLRQSENDPVVLYRFYQFCCPCSGKVWFSPLHRAKDGCFCRDCHHFVKPFGHIDGLTPYMGHELCYAKFECHMCRRNWSCQKSKSNFPDNCFNCGTIVYPYYQVSHSVLQKKIRRQIHTEQDNEDDDDSFEKDASSFFFPDETEKQIQQQQSQNFNNFVCNQKIQSIGTFPFSRGNQKSKAKVSNVNNFPGKLKGWKPYCFGGGGGTRSLKRNKDEILIQVPDTFNIHSNQAGGVIPSASTTFFGGRAVGASISDPTVPSKN